MSTVKELDAQIRKLQMERAELEAQENPKVCSNCGTDEFDADWMVDFTVVVSDGEEGYANITQLLCDDPNCFDRVQQALMDLGFVDHRHGSINFLEDQKCCDGKRAYQNCPTPTEYGQVLVTPTGPKQLTC